ncbi:MAG: ATP-binding cassette domain-containing protein [Bryobacteraceae bacterium]|jgi:ABC-type ATPase involved in cell division
MDQLVALENVSRRFPMDRQAVVALDGITATIDGGSFLVIAGPSGSGKSTLLNLIGCIDRPTGGAIRVAGEDIGHLAASRLSELRRRRIGFVLNGRGMFFGDVTRRIGDKVSLTGHAEAPRGKVWQTEFGRVPHSALVSVGIRYQL